MDKPTLGPDGSALWDDIAGEDALYVLRPDEYRLLQLAAEQLDRIAELKAVFSANPEYVVKGSTGQPVVNPLIAEIRQATAAFSALMRALQIPDDEERARQREENIRKEMSDLGRLSVKARKRSATA